MKHLRRLCSLPALTLGLLQTHAASAGGLFLYEIATPDAGLAAAGVAARAQDAATAQSNPAGMTRLQGDQYLIGGQLLLADAGFNTQTGTTTTGNNGDNPIAPTPGASAFYVHHINDDLSFGLAFYGNFGMALKYDNDWVGRYHVQEAGMMGATLSPSLAYDINPEWSVAAGLNLMYALFDLQVGLNTPVAEGDGRLKMDDTDTGIGGNLSVMFSPSESTRLGLLYTTEIDLEFGDRPAFSNLGDLGAHLVANRLAEAKINMDVTVPQSLMLSAFQQLDSQWALLGSLGWQDWSEFGLVGIELQAQNSTSLTVDRHYQDTWHASAGSQYQLNDRWLLSTGLAYDSSMVEDKYRTADMPVGETWRWGLGATYALDKTSSLNLSYTLNWSGDMTVDQQGGALTGDLKGEYSNTALHFFGLSYQQAF